MSGRNKALGLRPQRTAPTFFNHFGHREKMLPIKSVHDIARVVVDVSSQRSFFFKLLVVYIGRVCFKIVKDIVS